MSSIEPKDFKPENLVFGQIKEVGITGEKGKSIPMVCCDIKYKYFGKDSPAEDLVFCTYKCRTNGISRKFPYKFDGPRINRNITGYEISISITTNESKNNLNNEESALISMLDQIRELAFKYVTSSENIDQLNDLDRLALASVLMMDESKMKQTKDKKEKKCGIKVIKPIYTDPGSFVKDGKEVEVPHKMWGIRILTYKNKNNIDNPFSIRTRIVGPGNRPISPYKYIINEDTNTSGQVECAIQVRSLYFGKDMIKVQLQCPNINYYPYTGSSEVKNYLRPNTAEITENVEEDEEAFLNAQAEGLVETSTVKEDYNPQENLARSTDETTDVSPERETQPKRLVKGRKMVNLKKKE